MMRLGDICKFQSGGTPSKSEASFFGGSIPWITTVALNGRLVDDDDAIDWITEEAVAKSAAKIVPENSIMVGTRVGVGKVAINAVPMSTSQDIISLVDIDELKWYKPYLCYLISSKKNYFNSQARGATIKGIKIDVLASLEIPGLRTNEQQLIVAVLDKVSNMIALRRQQLSALDDLIKARFVEMFGDPIVNSKHLPTIRGDLFFKLSNGKFVLEEKRFEAGVPVYGGNGISWYTDEILVDIDTLVVGRVGFQSGNVHYAKGPLWVSDNAMYISNYNEKDYDLLFLCHLMEHIDFTRHQDAGDLKKITQKPFMAMEYIHPSLQQQQEYTAFVKQVDKSKIAVQKALDEAQVLFDSLMQQYFG